jgi:dTDP-4-amino-4,6-dideoxygalactose transaminase
MTKLFKPYVSKRAIWNVLKILWKGEQLAEGPQVKLFEQEFEKKFSVRNAVAVNSGTTALELAYELAGIKEGDQVITPVLTCTATNIPLKRRKAKIVFADVDNDLNISIADVKKKINKKTKAIVFVHFGGNNRGLKELLELGRKYNITIIEDAAQAVGSDFWGKADYTAVSLQAIKTLTSGDGGFLLVNNKAKYQRARRLRWFGYDRELKQKNGDTNVYELGYKWHMNDISAAIGRGNLAVIDKVIDRRRQIAKIYNGYGFNANVWLCSALVPKRDDVFMPMMKGAGIETGIHHYRNDKYAIFGGRRRFKNMDKIDKKYVLLPLHHDITPQEAHRIAKITKEYIEYARD